MPTHPLKLRPLLFLLLAAVMACAPSLVAQTNSSWIRANAPTNNASWVSVAMPAMSGPLVAAVYGGGIYTSTNSGNTWNITSAPTNQYWYAIATSSDGSKLVAVVLGGGIYTSTNSGSTWTPASAPGRNWTSVASSFDGKKLAAVADGDGIYTSTNSGATWKQTSASALAWNTIATSSDGNKLAAVVYGGGIYTSTNAGASWQQQTNAPSSLWGCLASSSDGMKLVAGIWGGGIYTSTNAGVSWSPTSAPGTNWLSIASSETGRTLLAGVGGQNIVGGIYTSTNFGTSWQQTAAPIAGWYSVATSLHGSKFIGAVFGGGIYSWQIPINQRVTTPEDIATNLVLTASSIDSSNLVYAILAVPTNGSLGSTLNTNTGAATYTPATNYSGADSFTFTVFDGSYYSTGMVSITVTPVNHAPAANNQSVTTLEDTATNLVVHGTDGDSNSLVYAISANPTNGTLTGLNSITGVVTYTPTTNYNGPDSFTFTVFDGLLYATGTVSIIVTPVNDPPVANNQSVVMLENANTNLVVHGTDVDSSNLFYGIWVGPTNGTLSPLNPTTGAVTYTPATNYAGADSFTFWVSDGSLFSIGTVSITVSAMPVAINQTVVTRENTATNLVVHGTDVGSSNLFYGIWVGPTNGTLSPLNPTNGAVTYTPATNYAGADSFTFWVSDGSLFSIGTVSLTVTPVIWLSLHYSPDTDALRFSWTNTPAAAGFALQQNADLTTTNWANVGVSPTNDSNLFITIIPRTGTNMFFRLKH